MARLVPVDHDPFDTMTTLNDAANRPFSASDAAERAAQTWMEGSRNYAKQMGPDVLSLKNLPKTWQNIPGFEAVRGFGPGGMGLAGSIEEAVPGIRAFHGSPYDFDRFDISQVGSGEGAQSFGHGLYFAEHPDVAISYRDTLASIKGTRVDQLMAQAMQGRSREQGIEILKKGIDLLSEFEDRPTNYEPVYSLKDYKEALARLEKGETSGRMYEVSIAAHPDQFLDWDKSLSEQSEYVREALAKLNIEGNPTGDQLQAELENRALYGRLVPDPDRGVRALVSKVLNDAGTPGIKYLDQGSRRGTVGGEVRPFKDMFGIFRKNAPNQQTPTAVYATREEAEAATRGTYNYVVFDDKLISIIKKYGIAALGIFPVGSQVLIPVDHDPFEKKK